jgi:hypothetical protein
MTIAEEYYRKAQNAYVLVLSALSGLTQQIERACLEHLGNAFTAYAFRKSRRSRIWARTRNCFFIVQENPFRALRRTTPPAVPIPKEVADRRLSRLHPEMIPYTSAFRQFYFPLAVNERKYVILTQPWPMGSNHVTVASAIASEIQDLILQPHGPQRVIGDLCGLVIQTNGMAGFWNGVGAGCSIEEVFHYHLLDRDRDGWPIELLCHSIRGPNGVAVLNDPDIYPFGVWSFQGAVDQVTENASRLLQTWYALAGPNATANLLATAEAGVVTLYVIPRDRRYEIAVCELSEGLCVGTLEVCGEIIAEVRPVPASFCDYDKVFGMLRTVRPMNLDGLASRSA